MAEQVRIVFPLDGLRSRVGQQVSVLPAGGGAAITGSLTSAVGDVLRVTVGSVVWAIRSEDVIAYAVAA